MTERSQKEWIEKIQKEEAERKAREIVNDELLAALKSMVRLWEAQAIVGTAPSGDAWAEIGKEVARARAAIDRAEGGAS
jgi:hypothetical protein